MPLSEPLRRGVSRMARQRLEPPGGQFDAAIARLALEVYQTM